MQKGQGLKLQFLQERQKKKKKEVVVGQRQKLSKNFLGQPHLDN
jgi:hypothetical protein